MGIVAEHEPARAAETSLKQILLLNTITVRLKLHTTYGSDLVNLFSQIIHSKENHWITASIILSKPGYIDLDNSLYDFLDTKVPTLSRTYLKAKSVLTYKIKMVWYKNNKVYLIIGYFPQPM